MTTADQLRKVNQVRQNTGAAKVDIITHSMGGLSSRSGDETPGTPAFGTWWSPCDEVINPDSSVPLGGAANAQTARLGHSALYEDATGYGQVREFVR